MKSSRLSLEVALTDRVTFTVAAGDRASYDAAKEAVLDLRLPVLWLFDGLDEVAQDDRMAPVLESFISSTSKALSAALGRTDDRVVVLSREERDSRRCPFPPGTYTSVLLLPWSADEVRRYVQCVAASLGCDALAATRMERSRPRAWSARASTWWRTSRSSARPPVRCTVATVGGNDVAAAAGRNECVVAV